MVGLLIDSLEGANDAFRNPIDLIPFQNEPRAKRTLHVFGRQKPRAGLLRHYPNSERRRRQSSLLKLLARFQLCVS